MPTHREAEKRTMTDLQEQILEELDLSEEIDDDMLKDRIYRRLRELKEDTGLSLEERAGLGRELFNAFRKLDLLQELVEDDTITEIMINGTGSIFIERNGRIEQVEKQFLSRRKLEDVIQQIVAGANRMVNEASPIADARLSDGSRVNIVLYPVALNGPAVTIRKFPAQTITMDMLVEWGALSREVAEFLSVIVKAKYNIFISGGTGSGKTTFLNALSGYIPTDERIITIEDNAELQIRNIPNLVQLEARNANTEGCGEITIRDLIRSALRMRPDRIIVGEVRGGECMDTLQAYNTGHDGSMSTGHANSTADMLSRLETMVLMGMELPLPAIRRQIASGLEILIHLGRLRDKSRRVLEITEITGYAEGEILLNPLFVFEELGMKRGKINGCLKRTGVLARQDKLLAAGYKGI